MRRDVYSTERAKSFSDTISSAGNRFLPADVSARWKGNSRRSDIPHFISQHFDEDADAIYEPWRGGGTHVCSSFVPLPTPVASLRKSAE